MTVKERLKQFITYKGISVRSFERDCGLSYGYVNNMRVSIQPDKITSIASQFPELNTGWLLTGEGEMLRDPENSTPLIKTTEAQVMEQTMIMNVPLVNQYAYAGYLSGYQDASYLSQLPTLPFIVDHEAQGNYVAFEVKGDSMNDGTEESYIEGDRLLCREIPQHLWCHTKLHIRKWDFIIVHSDGILVKRIIDHDVENHTITIHSLNPLYQDRIIDLCDVRQIFNVVELQRPRRR